MFRSNFKYLKYCRKHETTIQTVKRKLLFRNVLNLTCLFNGELLAVYNKQKHVSFPGHQLGENLILSFGI